MPEVLQGIFDCERRTEEIERCCREETERLSARRKILEAYEVTLNYAQPMPSANVQKELDKAQKLGEQLEAIAGRNNYNIRDTRDTLLLAHWSLESDFHKGVHVLVKSNFHGSAFALLRPSIECLVRAHVAVRGSDEDVRRINDDDYRSDFKEIGPWMDKEFGLNGHMQNVILNERMREVLHSLTHVGVAQLGRQFDPAHQGFVKPNYTDGELTELVRSTTSSLVMLTMLLTKHFGYDKEWTEVGDLLAQYK